MIRFEYALFAELDAALWPHAMHEATDTSVRYADDLRIDGPHSGATNLANNSGSRLGCVRLASRIAALYPAS
jgi:hypothetical protein